MRSARARVMRAALLLKASVLAVSCAPGVDVELELAKADPGAYACVRKYSRWVDGELSTQTERFVRDATGRFAIELLSLDGKSAGDPMTAAEKREFERVRALLRGGLGNLVANWRDFSVRDHDLFEANYLWQVLSQDESVAGRPAWLLDIDPRYPDRPSYTAWIDAETFVPLKIVETTPEGAFASTMEILEIDYSPDLSGVEFTDLSFVEQTPATDQELSAWANFKRFEPTYLPAGFELESTRLGKVAGFPVAITEWTDGVSELMLVQYGELAPGIAPTSGHPAGAFVDVRISRPTATVLEAVFHLEGTQVHVFGKVDQGELQTVIESFVPVSDP